MNLIHRSIGFFCLMIALCNSSFSQLSQPVTGVPAPSYFFTVDPSPDPALRHNRLLQQKTADGLYKLIGTYKVTGTPYLFGEKTKGDIFSTETKAYNIFLNYNTYNQELEFYSLSNPDQSLVKETRKVDSFVLHSNTELGIVSSLRFIYGQHIGSKEKSYYQKIYAGSKFSVYKKYKSELGYVSSNYIQSELRQFDLGLEFFYIGPDKKMKKIKPNLSIVLKEFKNIKDLSAVITDDAFTTNPDDAFKKVFESLNN